MLNSTYRIKQPTVTINGKTHNVTRDWTVTGLWYDGGTVCLVEVNGNAHPTQLIPIATWDEIKKELI